jgi:Trm5-related predicted tRNA methylase
MRIQEAKTDLTAGKTGMFTKTQRKKLKITRATVSFSFNSLLKRSFTSGVYLTAEADETLETLEAGTMYVIGGVVDRNRLPGVCAERAKQLNIVQKRLPIKENITVRFILIFW